MSLIAFWESNREEVEAKQFSQIVAIAGDGQLRDNSDTSRELRAYLSTIPTAILAKYLDECLSKSFKGTGFELQEIVNEMGSRLDCEIEHGLYRGRSGSIGFDGIWRYPNGYSLVIEVKTTDAYTIKLDTIAKYRDELIRAEKISPKSSILIVVGRNDTNSLEAQVRGSRHAWDVRIISADALMKLVMTKEETDSNDTIEKIRSMLTPKELTRLDFIVDLLATTADDIKQDAESPEAESESKADKEKKFTPVAFNAEVARAAQTHLGLTALKKKTRSLYTEQASDTAVLCLASRAYPQNGKTYYWYAFHPHQKEALELYTNAYVSFGCGSPDHVLMIPYKEFKEWLPDMNTTENDGRAYWHVQFYDAANGKVLSNFKANTPLRDLSKFVISGS